MAEFIAISSLIIGAFVGLYFIGKKLNYYNERLDSKEEVLIALFFGAFSFFGFLILFTLIFPFLLGYSPVGIIQWITMLFFWVIAIIGIIASAVSFVFFAYLTFGTLASIFYTKIHELIEKIDIESIKEFIGEKLGETWEKIKRKLK